MLKAPTAHPGGSNRGSRLIPTGVCTPAWLTQRWGSWHVHPHLRPRTAPGPPQPSHPSTARSAGGRLLELTLMGHHQRCGPRTSSQHSTAAGAQKPPPCTGNLPPARQELTEGLTQQRGPAGKRGDPAGAGAHLQFPRQQQPEHLQRLRGEEVPSAQLPPRRLCKITLSRSKAALRSRKKKTTQTPLCSPLSSLPRQSFISVVAEGVGALDQEVLPFPPAHAAAGSGFRAGPCPSLLPSARLKDIWHLLSREGEVTRVCEAPDLLQ